MDAEKAAKAHLKIRNIFHRNGRSRPFLIFPPLAAICAVLVYPHAGHTLTLAWCAGYLVYLLVRSISQRHDLANSATLIPWGHAKASAATNAAFFGALVLLTFERLSLIAQLQLTTLLLLAVVALVATNYNMETLTRIYHALILGPLALAWIFFEPGYWGIGAFIVVVAVASEVISHRARLYWKERVMLELDNEELAEKLSRQVMGLELMNRSRTEQLVAACHDLRQPAHAMSLSIAAALIETPEGELRDIVRGLQRSNSVLSEMLTSLMDLARLDSGAMQAHTSDVRLSPLLSEVRQQFSMAATHKGLLLEVTDSDLVAVSDHYLLRRIVFNLISNAIKYTKEGGVTVSVAPQEGKLVLTVRDTGIGIAPEHQARIFEDYTRLDPSSEGMGVGLSVVRRGCLLLGHALSVASSAAGTSVSITCRQSVSAGHPADDAAGAGGAELSPELQGKILVAVLEDDAESRLAMVRLLNGWGYLTLDAGSAGLLLQQFDAQGSKPDVLVTDLHLGAEDGLSAAILFRARDGLQDLPVIVVTGDLEAQTMARTRDLGFPMLYKPVRTAALREALHAATAKQAG